jgi:hypothetical protein
MFYTQSCQFGLGTESTPEPHSHRPGRVFLKGSANLLLLPRLAESLAEPLAKLWEMEFTPA